MTSSVYIVGRRPDGKVGAVGLDNNNNLVFGGGGSSAATATVTSVNDQATSTTLLAAKTSRVAAIIVNDSTAILYVKFGATASATSFTVKLNPGDLYELPQPVYAGRIDGIWSADASGVARVTEVA